MINGTLAWERIPMLAPSWKSVASDGVPLSGGGCRLILVVCTLATSEPMPDEIDSAPSNIESNVDERSGVALQRRGGSGHEI